MIVNVWQCREHPTEVSKLHMEAQDDTEEHLLSAILEVIQNGGTITAEPSREILGVKMVFVPEDERIDRAEEEET